MSKKKITPAITDETYENKLVALAYLQAQKQLEEGTASSQVITHFLKQGSLRAKLELEKIKHENKLIEARIESEKSSQQLQDMFNEVFEALKSYSYQPPRGTDVDIF
jgi:hypothetical protein